MPSFYVDRTSWPESGIWRAPTRSPILRHTFMRGSEPQIPVRFVSAGVVLELGNLSSVGIGFKEERASSEWLTVPVTATKTGTGTSATYTLEPSIMGNDLDALITAAGGESVAVIGEVYWTDSGTGGTAGTFGSGSIQFSARIYRNLNVGGETVPDVNLPWVTLTSADNGDTLTAGVQYLANTTAAAFTVHLPLSPDVGDELAIADAQETWATNNLTVGRNGQLINGDAENLTCDISRRISLVFVGGAQGWEVY